MDRQLIGLLECPAQRGWIEFTYTKGDQVRELKKVLNKRWGRGIQEEHWARWIYKDGWVILVEENDGSYLSLHDSDHIPSGNVEQFAETAVDIVPADNPSDDVASLITRRRSPGRLSSHGYRLKMWHPALLHEIYRDGVLDLFFAGVGHGWRAGRRKSVLQTDRYRLPIRMHREYDLPPEREYTVKLLALITIVGG